MEKILTKDNIIKFIKKFMPLIGIIILIYILYAIGIDDILSALGKLKDSPIHIIVAVVLTLPRILLRNLQWQFLLKQQKIFVSYIKSLKIFLIGYFYGAITPGYAGGLMRVPYLKEETNEPTGKLFVNVFVLSAVNTLLLYFMAVLGAFVIARQKLPETFIIEPDLIPLIACIVLVVQVSIYLYFLKRERGMKVLNFLLKIVFNKKLQSLFKRFIKTFYDDFPDLRGFIVPLLISIPCWIIMYSQIYILGLPMGIAKVPYFDFILLYAIANIISVIPITSGGLGIRELTLITLFGAYGVEANVAVVLGLVGHLITDVLTGLYGLVISFFEAKNNKKDISEIKNIFDDP